MKSNKFSKKNLDDETADLIDSKYPAELDVDRIFKKSYQGFLRANVSSDTEDEKFPETIVESSPVEVIQHERRFAFFTLSKVCAALCGVMAITTFYALLRMPDHDIETPDDINKIPIVTDNNNNISTNSSHMTTTQPNAAKTDSAETTTAVTSVFTSNSSTENTSSVEENTTTEVIATTELVQVTDNPEPTSAVPATTTLATTTTALTTTTTDTTTVTTTNTTTATTTSLPINERFHFDVEDDNICGLEVGKELGLMLLGVSDDETVEYTLSDEKIGKIIYADNTQVTIQLLEAGEAILTAKSSKGNTISITIVASPTYVEPQF